jgi:hypothetical protein
MKTKKSKWTPRYTMRFNNGSKIMLPAPGFLALAKQAAQGRPNDIIVVDRLPAS